MRSLVLCSVLAAAAARSPTLVRLAEPPRTARRSAATPLRVRGGGAAAAPVKTGKVWKPNTFTRDHVRFLGPNFDTDDNVSWNDSGPEEPPTIGVCRSGSIGGEEETAASTSSITVEAVPRRRRMRGRGKTM